MSMNPRLLRPIATGFNPKSIAGLAAWWDAADLSTLSQNSDGSSAAVATSDPVGRWMDKSGNARHVLQTVNNSRPLLQAGLFNGRSAVRFDGTDDSMITTSAGLATGAASRTLLSVYHPRSTTGTNTIAGQSNAGNVGAANWFVLQARQIPAGDPYLAGFSADSTNGASITQSIKAAGVTYDGTNVRLYLNGTLVDTDARTLNTVASEMQFGRTAVAGEFGNLDICEVLLYSRAVTDSERLALFRYLGRKWGTAIP